MRFRVLDLIARRSRAGGRNTKQTVELTQNFGQTPESGFLLFQQGYLTGV
jgi:hypothetical protein